MKTKRNKLISIVSKLLVTFTAIWVCLLPKMSAKAVEAEYYVDACAMGNPLTIPGGETISPGSEFVATGSIQAVSINGTGTTAYDYVVSCGGSEVGRVHYNSEDDGAKIASLTPTMSAGRYRYDFSTNWSARTDTILFTFLGSIDPIDPPSVEGGAPTPAPTPVYLDSTRDELKGAIEYLKERPNEKAIVVFRGGVGGDSIPLDIMKMVKENPNITFDMYFTYKDIDHRITIDSTNAIVDETIPWYGPEWLLGKYPDRINEPEF